MQFRQASSGVQIWVARQDTSPAGWAGQEGAERGGKSSLRELFFLAPRKILFVFVYCTLSVGTAHVRMALAAACSATTSTPVSSSVQLGQHDASAADSQRLAGHETG
jgi:hypothetical protein